MPSSPSDTASHSQDRRRILAHAETIIVKVGSRVLSDSNGRLDEPRIGSLARQLVQISNSGKHVVLVSSGAVASGIGQLGLTRRPTDLAELQAVAAVGQTHLIQTYERHFSQLGRHAAQVLLIADDLDDRARYLNVRNTLLACLRLKTIPIINENDTVSVEELQTTFGDNDRLAAMVTGVFAKSVLVILSDVEGVYDRDPSLPGAKVIHQIDAVDRSIFALASPPKSHRAPRDIGSLPTDPSVSTPLPSPIQSKGGMSSKLRVAQFVTQSGAPVVIAGGRTDDVLPRLMEGEVLGTLFLPKAGGLVPKKRWLGFSAYTAGHITIDDGAVTALRAKGSSLLPIGIKSVAGQFRKGEVISVRSRNGEEIARGLCNYDCTDLTKILGLRTSQIADKLGYCPYAEVIHRDNMTVL